MDDEDPAGDGPLYAIGELARRTGLTVKTVRFYSDRGIVTPAARTAAGYRRYGADAVARLDLVRTLRELGLDLATVRRVADRELPLSEVAATHAAALDVQIRVLRLRRAVLAQMAHRGLDPEELTLVHRLARLSADERTRLVGAFLDEVFQEHAADPAFGAAVRSLTAQLPDDAEPARVEAWVELAELSGDPGFRSHMRRLVAEEAAERDRRLGGARAVRPDLAATVQAVVAPAVAAGVEPGSPEAEPFVRALTAGCAEFLGAGPDPAAPYAPDGPDAPDADDGPASECGGPGGGAPATGPHTRLLLRLRQLNDPRRERYVRLLAVVNAWPAPRSLAPVLDWSLRALALTPPSAEPRSAPAGG
ncbi:MerR family transcriptional regulator [Actinacidiphila acidipaludis]|uniref:MerR family transcriptional regulator n=1 Tax=Actinacidiphila acidipaludis TaxID=2873382 RepID=A0ABS7Q410_9ACTN|nr:MerR family transcriptional regulator [Streptomyces acidipaludis]MBY8877903.1 MerR family transcriptional regulator [Streptomyces acidipaludis]